MPSNVARHMEILMCAAVGVAKFDTASLNHRSKKTVPGTTLSLHPARPLDSAFSSLTYHMREHGVFLGDCVGTLE